MATTSNDPEIAAVEYFSEHEFSEEESCEQKFCEQDSSGQEFSEQEFSEYESSEYDSSEFSYCTPVSRLIDHKGDISASKFHPFGELVLSAGFDKRILIGSVNEGESDILMVMTGHSDAIMDARFSPDGSFFYSCSQDCTVAVWDTLTGARIGHLIGHENGVNSVHRDKNSWTRLCSGSDDSTVRLWDVRDKSLSTVFQSGHQVTATCFDERGDHIISGGVDNDIKIWDIRKNELVGRLQGHVDAISGIALSPCGKYLLSNSIDNTLRIWDLRPFVIGDRCEAQHISNQYVMESNLLRCEWSPDGRMVAAGGSDKHVYIWDFLKHDLAYKLPGHESSVNDVDFHPYLPLIVSGSSVGGLYVHDLL